MPITSLSAVTLVVNDMARSTEFYDSLGFERLYGGPESSFTSYRTGASYLNLQLRAFSQQTAEWGRAIFYVDDVDAMHKLALSAGLRPEFEPRDAPWQERYFHIRDPDGHEISLAKPLR